MRDDGTLSASSARRLAAHLARHGQSWLVTLCFVAFLLTYLADVDASLSDPWGTLLTSQAILEHGTIRLDAYAADARWSYEPVLPAAGGHVYNYFPLGTSLVALPAVALARLRGEDMIHPQDNQALQNVLSSLTVVAAALLIWGLCRRFLPRPASFMVTAAFVFGTTIASTLGTALWSSNLALVLGLACLLVIAPDRSVLPVSKELLLGVLVFFAYLCRPTMALLFPLFAVQLFFTDKRGVPRLSGRRRIPMTFIASAGGLFALFVLFSWREYGALLPPYYQPSRLGSDHVWQALVGHLVSPSRGVLIGSPFLWLTLGGVALWARRLVAEHLVRLALAWIVLHWISISLFHHWWGGWSFGSRLFTEALPAFLLLTVAVTREASTRLAPSLRHVAAGLFLAAAAFAAFVHSHQGLYNVYAILWNEGIDRDARRVFDWRHPQFLATPENLGAEGREHVLLAMEPYRFGAAILPTSDAVVFEGWSVPEGDGAWRWSKSPATRILFKVAEPLPEAGAVLEIEAGTYGPQEVGVRLNGVEVGTLSSERNWDPDVYRWTLPREALKEARRSRPGVRIFELELDIPGAVLAGEGIHQRRIGVCLRRVSIVHVPLPAPDLGAG